MTLVATRSGGGSGSATASGGSDLETVIKNRSIFLQKNFLRKERFAYTTGRSIFLSSTYIL